MLTLPWTDWAIIALAIAVAASASWTDLRTGLIPNWLTGPGLIAGLGIGFAARGPGGLLMAAAAALVAGLVPLLLFRWRALGGGDVKLFAALGALLGPRLGLEVVITAFAFGGLWGCVLWWRRGELGRGIRRVFRLALRPFTSARRVDAGAAGTVTEIRFAPAILVAVVAVLGRALWG